MATLESLDPTSFVGKTLTSDPLKIDEEHLKAFAFSTYLDEDYVDLTVSRNNALGPELVDGFLLLSLLTYFSFDNPLFTLEGIYAFNYGLDKVRFTSPVMVGEEVYVTREVTGAKPISPTRARVTETIEMKRASNDELVMFAEWISYFVDGAEESKA